MGYRAYLKKCVAVDEGDMRVRSHYGRNEYDRYIEPLPGGNDAGHRDALPDGFRKCDIAFYTMSVEMAVMSWQRCRGVTGIYRFGPAEIRVRFDRRHWETKENYWLVFSGVSSDLAWLIALHDLILEGTVKPYIPWDLYYHEDTSSNVEPLFPEDPTDEDVDPDLDDECDE